MTLVVNKITEPGGIKSIRLEPDIVKVSLHGGREITYHKASEYAPTRLQRLYPSLNKSDESTCQFEQKSDHPDGHEEAGHDQI